MNCWVEYFANAVIQSCERAQAFEDGLRQIKDGWIVQTRFRADSAGRLLLDVLLGTPVLSIKLRKLLSGEAILPQEARCKH